MNGHQMGGGYGNQQLAQQGIAAWHPQAVAENSAPAPRNADWLIARAEERIKEIDAELARVPQLEGERRRLALIVATKEPSGAT